MFVENLPSIDNLAEDTAFALLESLSEKAVLIDTSSIITYRS